ncbi:MAG TPA: universal stress protein [Kofleriaceae bacterium]|nr:universal stress protein [Kofleriaceae bacterium]
MTPRIQTIVAGVDLSVPSDQALERAAAIAQLNGAALILVHAQADDAAIPDATNEVVKQLGEVSAAVRAEEARRLATKLDDLQARGIQASLVGRAGSPGDVVSEVAKEHSAELIVVGTHGHTGIQRFLLGSAATAILRTAPCDVLVTRGTSTAAAFSRPLVASDFSPAAARALRNAAALTAPGASIEVIHAWQLPAGSWGATLLGQARFPWNTVRDAVLSGVKAQADKLVQQTADLGHPIHVELVQGPPPSVITHAAERGGHDLIAIGTHGHRGFRRLLLGSVAESVIRHAPCSVLVAHGEHAGDTSKFTKI